MILAGEAKDGAPRLRASTSRANKAKQMNVKFLKTWGSYRKGVTIDATVTGLRPPENWNLHNNVTGEDLIGVPCSSVAISVGFDPATMKALIESDNFLIHAWEHSIKTEDSLRLLFDTYVLNKPEMEQIYLICALRNGPYKSVPDLAAEYKQRGLDRHRAWGQFVKDTIPDFWTVPTWHPDFGNPEVQVKKLRSFAKALLASCPNVQVNLTQPEQGYLFVTVHHDSNKLAEVYCTKKLQDIGLVCQEFEYGVFLFYRDQEIERYYSTEDDAVKAIKLFVF